MSLVLRSPYTGCGDSKSEQQKERKIAYEKNTKGLLDYRFKSDMIKSKPYH